MGERGRVVHVRGSGGAALLAGASGSFALLAANRRWASLVPIDGAEFDVAAFAAAVRAHVVQVWFDDDAGVSLQIRGPDGFAGELSVARFEDDGSGVEDKQVIDGLVRRKLLTATAARDLKARLADKPAKRDAWMDRHGVEAAFGFPFTEPMPDDADRDLLLQLAPGATIVGAKTAPAPRTSPPDRDTASASTDDWTAPIPRRYRLPDEARPTLDLHVFYWTEVWSMNSWALCNRYKKHLPAADRRVVDELCNACAMGNHEEIPARVEWILTVTWQAEDWGAFIRSPKVDDSGTDDDTARRWREMTGR